MLSPVLSGEKTYAEIVTHDDAWYAERGITSRFGETIVRIDRERRTVVGEAGEVPYDKLVIATGSAPFIIPVPGKDLPGVITYRDLDDTNEMIEAAAKPGANAVVIGGGLLGLEAAAGLRMRGMDVTVVHLMGHLMERQLDPAAGYLLQKELEGRGIKVHCKGATKAILGDGRVEAVLLEDGTDLSGRSGGDGRGHPPRNAAGQRRGSGGRTRHRRERSDAYVRPGYPGAWRMCRTSTASCSALSRRSTIRPRSWPRP